MTAAATLWALISSIILYYDFGYEESLFSFLETVVVVATDGTYSLLFFFVIFDIKYFNNKLNI
jgi:hypothetical protein